MSQFRDRVEELRWKLFQVDHDSGAICLVDVMGDESAIVDAARVSYGEGTKKVSDDITLIRYLMRHRHSTPFEMVELKFRVRVPMDTWRQWIRHRTASVNEYSTRYSTAIDDCITTSPNEWRLQATTNRQGSSGLLHELAVVEGTDPPLSGPVVAQRLTDAEREFHVTARKLYEERLAAGVAREQARKDLPLATYTEAYWKINLHNLLHFLGLRCDPHAQLEIRRYADVILEHIVKPLYPNVYQAFRDYRLDAMSLTAPEVRLLRPVIQDGPLLAWLLSETTDQAGYAWGMRLVEMGAPESWVFAGSDGRASREVLEFREKVRRMFIQPAGCD